MARGVANGSIYINIYEKQYIYTHIYIYTCTYIYKYIYLLIYIHTPMKRRELWLTPWRQYVVCETMNQF